MQSVVLNTTSDQVEEKELSAKRKWDEEPISQQELARLIESTYNYIFSVEDMRVQRHINKVEDLYQNAPLNFDAETRMK